MTDAEIREAVEWADSKKILHSYDMNKHLPAFIDLANRYLELGGKVVVDAVSIFNIMRRSRVFHDSLKEFIVKGDGKTSTFEEPWFSLAQAITKSGLPRWKGK